MPKHKKYCVCNSKQELPIAGIAECMPESQISMTMTPKKTRNIQNNHLQHDYNHRLYFSIFVLTTAQSATNMVIPHIPDNDAERLSELYKYELLDTVYEEEFDEVVQLASRICNVPISLITLVDMNRQWFKARLGFNMAETARNVSFCGHAILSDKLFEVEDAHKDNRFIDNPLVQDEPKIRYYAGMPLITGGGYRIGTLCVMDKVPRLLDEEQTFALKVLSKQVIKMFELRIRNKEQQKTSSIQQRIMSIMAHDIRGPLSSIKLSYELKSAGLLSEEDITDIDRLAPLQLDSTLNLLNNITDWGSLQLNMNTDEMEVFNLHDACEECFHNLLLSARSKNNKLINNIDSELEISGNQKGIQFVVRNLVSNANKFTSGGDITLSAGMENGKLWIRVKDTGVGMNEKTLRSVSERNWTNMTQGTHNEKGNGMGLKLIYEYLSAISGDIRFNSAPGQGTEVQVSIPVE